jgi:hypothetical protein
LSLITKVDVRATATVIEVWRDHQRITSHERSYGRKGTAVTKPEHRPQSHRAWGEWPPERIVGWAQTKGSKTGEVAAAILERGPHPESGRRACLGLMRMGEQYGDERLDAACARALAIGNPTLQSVKAILKNGLERVALVEEVETKSVVHENIRGGDYFDREEVSPTSDQNKIEARYLEDERFAIIHEPSADSSREKFRDGHVVEARSLASSLGVVDPAGPGLGAAVRAETLPMMLKRLQALWTRAPAVERGGDDSKTGTPGSSSCTSQYHAG